NCISWICRLLGRIILRLRVHGESREDAMARRATTGLLKARRTLTTVTISAVLGLMGSVHAVSAAESFKIGLIASYTGAFATWGTQFQNAIEAFQAINGKAVKGPKGEDIEVALVYRDAASAGADKAKQLAEELVLRERVKMLAGFE